MYCKIRVIFFLDVDSMDVNVNIAAVFHLHYPRWTAKTDHLGSKEFAFFCQRLRFEVRNCMSSVMSIRENCYAAKKRKS